MIRFSLIERRTSLKRGKQPKRGGSIKRGKPPRRVSTKRAGQIVNYHDVRAAVIARDGECVLGKIDRDECKRINSLLGVGYGLDPEHVNGRRGRRLTDEKGIVALHRACHIYVTDHAKEWKPKLRNYLAGLYGNR